MITDLSELLALHDTPGEVFTGEVFSRHDPDASARATISFARAEALLASFLLPRRKSLSTGVVRNFSMRTLRRRAQENERFEAGY
jgi:hypothetical protein